MIHWRWSASSHSVLWVASAEEGIERLWPSGNWPCALGDARKDRAFKEIHALCAR